MMFLQLSEPSGIIESENGDAFFFYICYKKYSNEIKLEFWIGMIVSLNAWTDEKSFYNSTYFWLFEE